MLGNGYVKLYRKILEHPIFTQLPPTVLKVWIVCLVRANLEPTKWYDGHQQIDIPAGAFIFSQDTLAKDCHLSRHQIRTALQHLQNLHCVAIQTTNKYSLLVVEKWTLYQLAGPARGQQYGQQVAIGEPTSGQQVATEEEYKKGRIEEKQQQGPSLITQTEWPETTATVQRRWESVDGMFVLRLVHESVQRAISCGVDPLLVTDSKLAEIVQESIENDFNGPKKNAAVLWKTVPNIIETRAKRNIP